MAHLSCQTHKQRVQILPGAKAVHRANGVPCATKEVKIGPVTLSVADAAQRLEHGTPLYGAGKSSAKVDVS